MSWNSKHATGATPCRGPGPVLESDRMANLPFEDYVRNQASTAVTLLASCLLAWTQLVCLDGDLAKAEPKTLRYRLLYVAARLAHRHRVFKLQRTQRVRCSPLPTCAPIDCHCLNVAHSDEPSRCSICSEVQADVCASWEPYSRAV